MFAAPMPAPIVICPCPESNLQANCGGLRGQIWKRDSPGPLVYLTHSGIWTRSMVRVRNGMYRCSALRAGGLRLP